MNNSDIYLNDENVIARLVKEWTEHKKLIIAVDFDSTIYDYFGEGLKFDKVINLLKECQEFGAYLVIFTSRNESEYDIIQKYLNKIHLSCDKINENIDCVPFNGRKIYYNILLDDRAGLSSAYHSLKQALQIMKNRKEK
jgi:hydroxymethylpyrimidine pyrophosphatase-like HAD family hydrolase